MKRSPITATVVLASLSAFVTLSPAAITTFSYTQTDNVTGAGTIAAPAPTNFGGVTITWSATAMPAASVRDPAGAGAAGAVGGWDAEEGNSGGNGRDVALYWNASTLTTSGASVAEPLLVTLSGSGDDGNTYSVSLSLVFFGDLVQNDENFPGWGNNDYRWSIEYGDVLGTNPEGNPRTGIWLSPTFANVAIADGGGGRQQRYTQNANDLNGILTNTDTTSGAEKDAIDRNADNAGGATGAIGQPLEFGFGWRDDGSLTGGPVLIDSFQVEGLLEFDEGAIVLIPEPGTFSLLGLAGVALVFFRRRRR